MAIQIKDQDFPKMCGNTPFKRVVPMMDMVEKVKVAVEARRDPETLITARTDARQTDGFEGALKRGIAYGDVGADVVFIEALESEDEMREACRCVTKPKMANMADGRRTPIRSKAEMQNIGYNMATFPAATGLAAAAAAEAVLSLLESQGTSLSLDVPLFNFSEFNSLIGFDEVWGFERRWTRETKDNAE